MHVIGRDGGRTDLPAGRLGTYRARDGGDGAPAWIDLDRPHAALVVGKRGSGKTHTLGVIAEAAARADGVAPAVIDPMGALAGLAAEEAPDGDAVPARVRRRPRVEAAAVPPAAWPALLGLDPTGAAGGLVWRAAAAAETLAGMRSRVADADADPGARRAAENHLALAASWDAFDPGGLAVGDLLGGEASVLDLSGLDPAPANAVCHAVAAGLYERLVSRGGRSDRLPWLFVDEAHLFFDGVAGAALRTLCTRGRQPGVSLVAATQRPSALPAVAVSQADQLIAHRLTAAADVDALAAARPASLDGPLGDRLPDETGTALVVDDATASVHEVRVRERETPRGGASPRASDRAAYE